MSNLPSQATEAGGQGLRSRPPEPGWDWLLEPRVKPTALEALFWLEFWAFTSLINGVL